MAAAVVQAPLRPLCTIVPATVSREAGDANVAVLCSYPGRWVPVVLPASSTPLPAWLSTDISLAYHWRHESDESTVRFHVPVAPVARNSRCACCVTRAVTRRLQTSKHCHKLTFQCAAVHEFDCPLQCRISQRVWPAAVTAGHAKHMHGNSRTLPSGPQPSSRLLPY